MRSLLSKPIAFLGLAAAAFAQSTYVVAPDTMALSGTSSTAQAWRFSATGFRSQFVYDTSHFTNYGCSGPILIQRLRFRASNASAAVGGTYVGDGVTTGVTIDIGTAASDYNAASTTFASNRGTMQNVMTFGTVVVAPALAATPNTYVVDIAIPGGFVYDPTLGQDLLIDVTGPAFTGTLSAFASGSVTAASSRGRLLTTTTPTSATGTLSYLCPVVLFDIAGSGGIPDDGFGNPVLVQSSAVVNGTGCGNSSTFAFAEEFPGAANTALDLGTGIALVPNVVGAPTAYTVQANSGAPFFPRGATPLLSNAAVAAALTDTGTSQPCALPFVFPYPGGSTSTIHVTTDGYILLQPTTTTSSDPSASLAEFATGVIVHTGVARLCPCWYDFHAGRNTSTHPGAGIYFDVDVATNKAYVTWENVGEFATTAAGAKVFNFQVELSADGSVDYRYGAMSTFGGASASTSRKVVGFTPGAPAPVPASADLSAAMPFATGTYNGQPLLLASSPPRIGSPLTLTTSWIPAPGIGANFIGGLPAGIDLTPFGAPGCSAYVDLAGVALTTVLVGTTPQAFSIPIPSDPIFVGFTLFSQSLGLDATYGTFGFVTSNGVTLNFGSVF